MSLRAGRPLLRLGEGPQHLEPVFTRGAVKLVQGHDSHLVNRFYPTNPRGVKGVGIPDRLAVVEGDITRQQVDAIVNAANTSLLGGGGVDGAVHRAAGTALLEECRKIGGCPTGEARITGGHELPARWVIHTVGPVWRGGGRREEDLLARCYRSCFALAEQHALRTIAFPSIGTGAYGFPVEKASRIALRKIRAFLERTASVERVTVVCFESRVYASYLAAAKELAG